MQAISDYCKAVFDLAVERLPHTELGQSFRLEELKRMPKRARVSMPQLWSPKARARVLRAVHSAGANIVVPASEPQCAIADFLDKTVLANLPTVPKKGDYILVADLGCGTGDFVLYQLKDDLGVGTPLDAVGKANGALCGSHWVNEAVYERLNVREDGSKYDENLKGKMSPEAFRWHFLRQIEGAKVNKQGVARVTPICVYKDGECDRLYDGNLKREDVEAAHVEPIKAIMAAIDSLIAGKPAPKLILIAGGFGKSEFVRKAMFERYNKENETVVVESDNVEATAVAEGALSSRYDAIANQRLPFVYSYALIRDEVADQDDHPDCFRKKHGKMIPVRSRVKRCPYGDSEDVDMVIDRLVIILDNQDLLSPNPTSKSQTLLYRTSPTDLKVTATLVYLDPRAGSFRDHESALVKTHDAGLPWGKNDLRDGVHEWVTVTGVLDGNRLANSECDLVADDEGNMLYHFDADVTIRYEDETDMTINWRIKAGKDEWDVRGEIWNGSFSEFSREHGDVDGDVVVTDDADDEDYKPCARAQRGKRVTYTRVYNL
ncbi:uncharacterized protein MYCFIDRAFT_195090 [Pseudocercospora fijiensis CIRAD86]|uniref:Uncharacterized protein n=1 Tax=Pseudocercospora fijiensis (strain CIRAD86) TaxID=383855 RepID=M3AH42_PSEFD|nr:uncharacterized protein MYCFIDRAFT_195090 [Pseudocercospora fijiensis CIRAD86]EME83886.1 hypothetical protein MYCFIDRAFT_195090 [Pseudocercospora fijiensis CIRAD86]